MKLEPLFVKPFDGQLCIQLSEVTCYTADKKIKSYLSPDVAFFWNQVLSPNLCPDDSHIYLYVSSSVDVFRPWMVSYRAAQIKSNASLPGESPHNFGLSWDLDLRKTREAMSDLSRRYLEGKVDFQDKVTFNIIHRYAPKGWVTGRPVSDVHIRSIMKGLGATPHKNLAREAWHINGPNVGDSNGALSVLTRYPNWKTLLPRQN
jgi:hypothetical protein